jgi:L-histidine N-alpha-methyltransferase
MSQKDAAREQTLRQPAEEKFASDVEYYLTQDPRQLPSRYLYDALGSALFEAICRLPWYPLTRVEHRLLETHGRAVFELLHPLTTVLELGSGSGEKLATLLGACDQRLCPRQIHLVDISPSALDQATRTLLALGDLKVIGHQATYEAGLGEFSTSRRGGRALALFLGSNIGNFDRPGCDAFLRTVRAALRPGDGWLLGTDLVRPERDLLLAYDDPLGVTAAFDKNLLVRINRDLGGNFDLEGFAHRAVWNAGESRVEMHLVSLRTQRVQVPGAGLDLTLAEGESIWTESSYKFTPERVHDLLQRNGFRVMSQWVDKQDGFALTLSVADGNDR